MGSSSSKSARTSSSKSLRTTSIASSTPQNEAQHGGDIRAVFGMHRDADHLRGESLTPWLDDDQVHESWDLKACCLLKDMLADRLFADHSGLEMIDSLDASGKCNINVYLKYSRPGGPLASRQTTTDVNEPRTGEHSMIIITPAVPGEDDATRDTPKLGLCLELCTATKDNNQSVFATAHASFRKTTHCQYIGTSSDVLDFRKLSAFMKLIRLWEYDSATRNCQDWAKNIVTDVFKVDPGDDFGNFDVVIRRAADVSKTVTAVVLVSSAAGIAATIAVSATVTVLAVAGTIVFPPALLFPLVLTPGVVGIGLVGGVLNAHFLDRRINDHLEDAKIDRRLAIAAAAADKEPEAGPSGLHTMLTRFGRLKNMHCR